MPAPYPTELRERVVAAHHDGEGTFAELAERFAIGEATVNRWVSRERRTGGLEAEKPGGSTPLVDAAGRAFLEDVLAEIPDSTGPELISAYEEAFGIRMSTSTMYRTLRQMGFTRKRGPSARPLRSGRTWWRSATPS